MVATTCQQLISPAALPRTAAGLSIFTYNVLLPNSQDGWWNYKMYLPPLSPEEEYISTWEYRRSLLQDRIGLVDADIVCIQEVSPLSFEEDFSFMSDILGYDGVELFRKGRFRPATFWKKNRVKLVSPAQHKDRTLLTTFRLVNNDTNSESDSQDDNSRDENWHVLNCHLQAGQNGGRRVRQIVEGITAATKLAKKLKEPDLTNINLIVCGDFNGGEESGAVHYLEKGFIGPDFLEEGEPVSSKEKKLPLASPMTDVASINGCAAPTLVVPELISLMIEGGDAYTNPNFSHDVIEKLKRIYTRFATVPSAGGSMQMGTSDAERWLTIINGKVGRGSEFRTAAKFMGWVDPVLEEASDELNNAELKADKKDERPAVVIPDNGILTLDDFIGVYLDELRQGKFWGIAWDLAALEEPLMVMDVFTARYDRIYCSKSLSPFAVLDFHCKSPCPNKVEPSDHLPVAASFIPNTAVQ